MDSTQIAVKKTSSASITLLVVSVIQFIMPFLMSATYVALPSIGKDLQANAVQMGLAITFFVLTIAATALPAGRFADIYGRKKIFISGMVLLTIATVAIGVSTTIEMFLVLRLAQGIGCGLISSTSMAILTSTTPKERRGKAMGITISMVYLGLSLGPSLSGFIVSYAGWRGVFFLISALLLLAILLTTTTLKGEWTSAPDETFDYKGSAVFFISLCLFVFGASTLTDSSWFIWLMFLGIAGLGLFCYMQWRSSSPLLDLHFLATNLTFSFSNLATFLNYASITSFTFLFSLYLQYVKGFSPKHAGIILVLQPVLQAILAPFVGRLSDQYPPSAIATIGMGFCTMGLFSAAFINQQTTMIYIVIVLITLGISLGLFSTSNMTAIMNSVGPRYYGTAASMVSTMRMMGMLCSGTLIAIILSLYFGKDPVTQTNTPVFIRSMQTSLYLFSSLSLLGTIFSMVKGQLAGKIKK